METNDNTKERLMKLLMATPSQLAAIDKILSGETLTGEASTKVETASGPLLLSMGAAAKYLGVGRSTLWRMIKAGRVQPVELLPGTKRVRRADLIAIAVEE
jgi:excisionase family DNA binding protein